MAIFRIFERFIKNEHFIKVLIKLQENREIYIINLVEQYRFVTILLAYVMASLFQGHFRFEID